MNGDVLADKAELFDAKLRTLKDQDESGVAWYPYGTLLNFVHLRDILNEYSLSTLTGTERIGDVGAADGDLAFFLAQLGYRVDIIDYGPTNFNGLRGCRRMIKKLKFEGRVRIHETDLDNNFSLPSTSYSLIFCLGILYHLKNPYRAMECLSKVTRFLILSTRVAKFTREGTYIADIPSAYLVDPQETNNDSTNYWIFTNAGLKRLVERSGWRIVAVKSVGDTERSNPSDPDRDERAFMLLESRNKIP